MIERMPNYLGLDDAPLTYHGLARTALVILFAAGMVALVCTWARPYTGIVERVRWTGSTKGIAAAERLLCEYLTGHTDDVGAWKLLVRLRTANVFDPYLTGPGPRQLPVGMPNGSLNSEPLMDETAFLAFLEKSSVISPSILKAWYRFNADGLEAGLAALGPLSDSARYTAAAEMHEQLGRLRKALEHYRQAAAFDPNDANARNWTLRLLLDLDEVDEATALITDRAYRRAAEAHILRDIYRQQHDFLRMLPHFIGAELATMRWHMFVASLVTGLTWFIFCLHMGYSWRWPRRDRLTAAAAVCLGYLSAIMCLFLVVVTDELFQTDARSGIEFNLIYCIAGIGAREELTKLLFFVPLVPFLMRMENDLSIITIASLTGLGFAVNENIKYYAASGGVDATGRFLTANFFHMVLTGYCGYYLVKAFQHGGESWNTFTGQTLKMIVIHGLYDFILIEPRMADYSILAMTVYIWLSQTYLRLILETSANFGWRPIPLTRLFVAAISIVVGVTYILIAGEFGMVAGFRLTVFSLLGVALISYMFFREFNEPVRR